MTLTPCPDLCRQARLEDVAAGQLPERYAMRVLREVSEEYQAYSASLAPVGWECLYDWDSSRHYYRNASSGQASWEYPTAAAAAADPAAAQPPPPEDTSPVPGPEDTAPPPPDGPPPPDEVPPPLPTEPPPAEPSQPVAGVFKKKKRKAQAGGGKRSSDLQKDKKLSGLVQKWAKVQETVNSDDDVLKIEAEREARQARGIEAWKSEQVQNKASEESVNFQPIGDWKKRRQDLLKARANQGN